MTTHQPHRVCSLAAAAGKDEACPEDACPFWERHGCAFERVDLADDAALASWLLEIRARLGNASSAEEERALRSAFHHLLNDSEE